MRIERSDPVAPAGPQVLVARQLDFASDHQGLARRTDSHSYPRAPNMCNDNLNVAAYEDGFTLAARHHEHTAVSCGINSYW